MKKVRTRVLENNTHLLSQFCRWTVDGIKPGNFHTSGYFSGNDLGDESSQNTGQGAFSAAGRSRSHSKPGQVTLNRGIQIDPTSFGQLQDSQCGEGLAQ
jgi:hypothetical protein